MYSIQNNSFKKFIFALMILIMSILSLSFTVHLNTNLSLSLPNNESLNPDVLNVLDKDCSHLYYDFLLNIAQKQFDERSKNYQARIKSQLNEISNTFPEKTSLNARTTGIIECKDYKIENIVFESRPNLYVAGNLYIPTKGMSPFPAVLKACGHQENGKANINTQKIAILFAKNGFVTLVIDTYAQGERKSVNHTQIDIGAMLVGTDLVAYQAWDNIRAIDYLCSRPEVNQDKIGITGHSGGGTQTVYMMGFDPRIKVAAPACGLHTRERMFTWNGLADGCHNFAKEGMKMIEFSDYFILFAPKPALVLAGEMDQTFDITAAAKAVREAKWFYKELGAIDQIDIFTVDEDHGYHQGLREAAVWWFKKWLMNDPDIVKEPKLTVQLDEKLQVTKTGQVLTEFKNSKSIIDINIQQANNFKHQRKMFWRNNPKKQCIEKVKELINYKNRTDKKNIQFTVVKDIKLKDVAIRKLLIVGRDGFPLPALMYIPADKKTPLPATLYLNDNGKNKAFDTDSVLNVLINDNRIVLAVDIRGFGETFVDLGKLRKSAHLWNDQHQISQTATYIGYPLIGQRVQDAIDALDHLLSYPIVKKSDIEILGIGHCGIVALHSAAIDSRFSSVKIINSISSFMDIISEPEAKNQFKNVVPGAMKYYDLPDLVNSIVPRPLKIIEAVDSFGKLKP
jgi:cephalosporin-C deacetylase-like acetyl esterase